MYSKRHDIESQAMEKTFQENIKGKCEGKSGRSKNDPNQNRQQS